MIKQLSVIVRRWRKRRLNKNLDFSILCNNCVGAMVTHDLGVRLNTPTVNLFIYPKDYLAMLENLEQNIYAPIEDITGNSPYPVGLLAGSIHLYFQHYKSFDEAVECWRRRAPRLNMKNLFVVMIERDGCSYEDLKRFDALPYKNKLL